MVDRYTFEKQCYDRRDRAVCISAFVCLIGLLLLLTSCSIDSVSTDYQKIEYMEAEFTFCGWDEEGMILLDEKGRRSSLELVDASLIPFRSLLYEDLEEGEKLIVDRAVEEKGTEQNSGQVIYATRYGILRRANGKEFHNPKEKTLELIYKGVKEEGTAFRRYGNGITAYLSPQEKDRNESLKNTVIYENGMIPDGGLNRYEACEILLFEGENELTELYFVDNMQRLLNFNQETQHFDSCCTPDELTPGTRYQIHVADNLFRNGEWVYTISRIVPDRLDSLPGSP